MATRPSLPTPFEIRMQQQLELNDYDAFKQSLDSTPPTSIHLNPRKNSKYKKIKDQLKSVPWSTHGFYLQERPLFTTDPGFQSGGYYVQEASSMSIEQAMKHCLGFFDQPKVLDLCASPGGKSTLLLSMLDSKGLLVSNDTIRSRIDPLQHNLIKWGYPNQIITSSDPERFAMLKGFFDIILVDAPCSGEGLFRKDAHSRNEWSESNTKECVLRQKRILKEIVHTLSSGGFLIYSTCTYNPEENLDQVHQLTQMGLSSVAMSSLEEVGFTVLNKNGVTGYQAYPHKICGEGFFISLLHKDRVEFDRVHHDSTSLEWVDFPSNTGSIISTSGQSVFKYMDSFYLFPTLFKHEIQSLSKAIHIIQAGTSLGQYKQNDFIPHHALSQSIHILPGVPAVTLDSASALEYLKRNALYHFPESKGYHLIKFEDQVLGWVKAIQGRLNNLYPIQYRIKGNF